MDTERDEGDRKENALYSGTATQGTGRGGVVCKARARLVNFLLR